MENNNIWQPIETAPRDGTAFIGVKNGLAFRTFCQKHYKKWPHEDGGPTYEEKWNAESAHDTWPWSPTHWIPLPPEGDKSNG